MKIDPLLPTRNKLNEQANKQCNCRSRCTHFELCCHTFHYPDPHTDTADSVKSRDLADISVPLFSAGANFWAAPLLLEPVISAPVTTGGLLI